MKIRFRVALLTLLIGMSLATVAAVGLPSYLNARAAARLLAMRILSQTSLRIDQEVGRLLERASDNPDGTAQRIKVGRLREDDFDGLIAEWLVDLEVDPDLSSLFIALESTGESVGVSRIGTETSIWAARDDPKTGKRALKEYYPRDYPHKPYRHDPSTLGPDSRVRPWYTLARDTGHPVWTDAYVFLGVGDVADIYGVTYAVPIYRDGKLTAVLTADFVLDELCRFLQRLEIGGGGYAFLIEQGDDGRRRMIAHPRPELVVGPSRDTGKARDFVPIGEIADPLVRAFLAALPPSRPNTAADVGATLTLEAGGARYLGSYRPYAGKDGPPWLICTILPEAEILAPADWSGRVTLAIMAAAVLIAGAFGVYVSSQVAAPLERMARDAARVGHLRLEAPTARHSIVLEVDRLRIAGEEMKAGLRSFGKYVPIELVRTLLDSGREAILGGERRVLTIYFSDIANFTREAESLTVEALVDHLGDYLGAMSETILATGGTVDKFIGDAVMAFWGAPEPHPSHALAACTAALANQRRLEALGPEWQAAGKPSFTTRIGLNTGEVVVGNIGNPPSDELHRHRRRREPRQPA